MRFATFWLDESPMVADSIPEFSSAARTLLTVAALCAALSSAMTTRAAAAQSGVVLTLERPEATWSQGFSSVASVRELRDKRLLVVDAVERSVAILDPSWSSVAIVGRVGSGPGEYGFPTRLFALSGDSTAVLDPGNARLLLILPNGQVDRTMRPPACTGTDAIRVDDVRVVDGSGRFYSEALPIERTPSGTQIVDSAAIVRWQPGSCARDTIGFVPRFSGTARAVGRSVLGGERPPPFAPTAEWTVGADGRLALVRPEPFTVVIVDSRGVRHAPPAIQYASVRVEEGHKEAWRAVQARPRLVTSRNRGSQAITHEFRRIPVREPERWPSQLPPFLAGGVRFAPDGKLWMERTTPAGAPSVLDVFGADGLRVMSIQLPPERRFVGLGVGTILTTRTDQDTELEILERYRQPVMPRPR